MRQAFSWNNGADLDDELDHAAPEAIAVDDPRRPQLVELRRYRLRPGRRDELIELFDRELLQPQETVGLQVLGQFRDADEPDQFVWLRGFGESDPDVRARSLEAFYTGPTWAAHGPAANATMLDSDDVLLLRPAREDLALEVPVRPATALSGRTSDGIVLATTCLLAAPADEGTLQAAVDALQTAAGVGGYQLLAVLISADVPNAYPALPVRDEAHACVWLEAFVNLAAAEAELVARSRRAGWQAGAPVELARLLRASAYVSRLSPTTQSLLPSPADA